MWSQVRLLLKVQSGQLQSDQGPQCLKITDHYCVKAGLCRTTLVFNKRNTKLVVDLLTYSAYIKFINTIKVSYMHLNTKSKTCLLIFYGYYKSKSEKPT